MGLGISNSVNLQWIRTNQLGFLQGQETCVSSPREAQVLANDCYRGTSPIRNIPGPYRGQTRPHPDRMAPHQSMAPHRTTRSIAHLAHKKSSPSRTLPPRTWHCQRTHARGKVSNQLCEALRAKHHAPRNHTHGAEQRTLENSAPTPREEGAQESAPKSEFQMVTNSSEGSLDESIRWGWRAPDA
jgi:hypothetical protein